MNRILRMVINPARLSGSMRCIRTCRSEELGQTFTIVGTDRLPKISTSSLKRDEFIWLPEFPGPQVPTELELTGFPAERPRITQT
jgi:hypothetical protein